MTVVAEQPTTAWTDPPIRLQKVEVKALVRHRDGYRCTECGVSAAEHIELHGRNLDVHRVVPGSKYTVQGCVTLCRDCHGPKPRTASGGSVAEKVVIAIPDHLYSVIKAIAKRERRAITAQLCIALEWFLTKESCLPSP